MNLFKYIMVEVYNKADVSLNSPNFKVDPVHSPSKEILDAYRNYMKNQAQAVELGKIRLYDGDEGEPPMDVFIRASGHFMAMMTLQRDKTNAFLSPEKYTTPESRKEQAIRDLEDIEWLMRQCAFRIANVWKNKPVGTEFIMYSVEEMAQGLVVKMTRRSPTDMTLAFVTFLPQSKNQRTRPTDIVDMKLDFID